MRQVGGGSIGQELRQKAVKRKQAARRRMRDYLADPLLRQNMIRDMRREFEYRNRSDDGNRTEKVKVNEEAWIQERLQDLEFQAKQPVTDHDVVVSKQDVLKAVSTRIYVATLIFVLVLVYGWCDSDYTLAVVAPLIGVSFVVHIFDNEVFILKNSSSKVSTTSESKKGTSLPFDV